MSIKAKYLSPIYTVATMPDKTNLQAGRRTANDQKRHLALRAALDLKFPTIWNAVAHG